MIRFILGVIWMSVSVSHAKADTFGNIPEEFLGLYVMVDETLAGEICRSEDWEVRGGLGDDPVQMKVEPQNVLYYHGAVSCEVVSISPTSSHAWPRYEAIAYDLDMKCYDEGTVGRHRQVWHLVKAGSQQLLLTSQASRVPEVWLRCKR